MVTSVPGDAGFCVQLARRLGEDALREPGPETADLAARRVFDTLGALAVGQRLPGRATLSSALHAGILDDVRDLCALTRRSEIDDIDPLGLVTPGAAVVPTALALGGLLGVEGSRLLAAVIAGYETMITLAEGLDGARLLGRGVWPTYLLAPVATAAVAASLWRLDVARTADALALALARAAGVAGRPPREPTSRWWLCGCAAADGLLAAEAAGAGLAGDPGLLERGLGSDGAIGFDATRLRPGDPLRIEVVETKPFCVARQVLPAVAAAQALRARLGARAVEAITLAVPVAYRGMVDRPAPVDRASSLQSAQFQVAAALSDDPVLHDPVRSPPILGRRAGELMRATTVVEDPVLSTRYPAVWSARVLVRTIDGDEMSELVFEYPGEGPAAGWEELVGKYVRAGWAHARAESLARVCRELSSAGPDWAKSSAGLGQVRARAHRAAAVRPDPGQSD